MTRNRESQTPNLLLSSFLPLGCSHFHPWSSKWTFVPYFIVVRTEMSPQLESDQFGRKWEELIDG